MSVPRLLQLMLSKRSKNQVCDLDNDVSVIQEAAKLLHRDVKSCKLDKLTKSQYGGNFFNMSHAQAASMIPCKMLNFQLSCCVKRPSSRAWRESVL